MSKLKLLVLTLVAAFALTFTGSARAASSSWAGHWSYIVEQSCNYTPDTQKICNDMLGGWASWSNWFDATANAKGKIKLQAGFVATEDKPSANHFCNIKIFSQDFNGSCLVTDHGTGFIKEDAHGTPYFWISSEEMTFHGKRVTVVDHPVGTKGYPFQNNLAVPGVYDTTANLRMVGEIGPTDTPPTGVYYDMTVTHRP